MWFITIFFLLVISLPEYKGIFFLWYFPDNLGDLTERDYLLCILPLPQGWAALESSPLIFAHCISNASSFTVQIFLKALRPGRVAFCSISFGELWIYLLETPSTASFLLHILEESCHWFVWLLFTHLFLPNFLCNRLEVRRHIWERF